MLSNRAAKKSVGVILACLLSPAAFAAGDGLAPDFDQGAAVAPILKEARAKAKEIADLKAHGVSPKGGSLWISLGGSDLGTLDESAFPLGAPVSKSSRAAVYEMPVEMLPLLSQFMHEKFNRCGGFFAHRTRQEAEKDLSQPVKASGGPYTLDQQAWVNPLMAMVKEDNIRSTISSLAAYNNRYYTADSGVEAAHWLAGQWQGIAAKLPWLRAPSRERAGWSCW